jgi:hypothetical protein
MLMEKALRRGLTLLVALGVGIGSLTGCGAGMDDTLSTEPASANGDGSPNTLKVAEASLTYNLTWESLGGTVSGRPSVVSWSPGHLDVYVRGSDNALHHRWYGNNQWSAWGSLGGVMTSDPAMVSWGTGHLVVFARGASNSLGYRSYYNGWADWQSLGGADPGQACRGVLGHRPHGCVCPEDRQRPLASPV